MGASKEKKALYFEKVKELFSSNERALVVLADNVGSKQFMNIRIALRGKGTVLMGKNTLLRKAIRDCMVELQGIEKIMPALKQNVGIIFTNEDFGCIREILDEYKVGAPAKLGSIAPCDVTVPQGGTGMEPTMTSFFQALGIATKIERGQIEMISDVHLISTGDVVTASQATLLQKLNIKPFKYGLLCQSVFDENRNLFPAAILDISDEDLTKAIVLGIRNIASLSLAANYPTSASVPHSIINGFKNILGVALSFEEYTFEALEKAKDAIANPTAVAAAPAAGAEEAKEEVKEESEEESDDGSMGFDLFD